MSFRHKHTHVHPTQWAVGLEHLNWPKIVPHFWCSPSATAVVWWPLNPTHTGCKGRLKATVQSSPTPRPVAQTQVFQSASRLVLRLIHTPQSVRLSVHFWSVFVGTQANTTDHSHRTSVPRGPLLRCPIFPTCAASRITRSPQTLIEKLGSRFAQEGELLVWIHRHTHINGYRRLTGR